MPQTLAFFVVSWVFFNVILALLPIFIGFFIAKMVDTPANWVDLLKNGELFFFSTIISASSIHKTIGMNWMQCSLTFYLSFLSLLLILICSPLLLGATSYLKIKNGASTPEPETSSQLIYRRFSITSIGFAALSVILGFYINFIH